MKTPLSRNKKGFTPLEIHKNSDRNYGNVFSRKINKRKHSLSLTGFTLIELILVAVIISIITVVALPRFRKTFQELQAKEFIQNLTSLALYARERAVLERNVVRVNLDFSKHIYWLSVKELNKDEFRKLNDRISRSRIIPETISAETDINHIDFYPDGRTDKISLVIKNNGTNAYTLISDENLGLLKLQ
ncbi:MAG: prepilin-type N-terminal cleavage/methylation domain-containing protein [Candidatus Omnitrophota bacterium]